MLPAKVDEYGVARSKVSAPARRHNWSFPMREFGRTEGKRIALRFDGYAVVPNRGGARQPHQGRGEHESGSRQKGSLWGVKALTSMLQWSQHSVAPKTFEDIAIMNWPVAGACSRIGSQQAA